AALPKSIFSALALHVGFTQGAVQSTAPHSQNTTASRIYSVFYVPKIPTYQISQKYRAALPKSIFSALALHVGFAQGAVQSTAPHSQNTTASRIYSVFSEEMARLRNIPLKA
ncbi:MAG: hypothetical protein J6R08_05725, partial [Opitutales bacterium]|nr:hypothetical protein [Opitutales bacterium]